VWRLVPFIVTAALMTAAVPAAQESSVESKVIYGGLVSFELPVDWQAIAPTDLEELSMRAADATSGRSVEVYQHGYVPPEFETDPWLPHVLVQIRESGRIPYGEFLHLRPIEEIRDASMARFPEGLRPLVMGITVDRVSFDPSTFCVRIEYALELRFKGSVRVLTAAFLTERGMVAIHHIDRKIRIDESRERFDAIVESVSIDPSLAYKPRLLDRWPGLPYFIAAGIVAIALVAYLLRRRSQS
jgi:hypothetical protein